jgi:ubiquitin-protein ligase E3 A
MGHVILTHSYVITSSKDSFSVLRSSYLLTLEAKARLLKIAAHEEMQYQINQFYHELLQGVASSPVLPITVRRDHIVEDALNQLTIMKDFLKRPLKVTFVDEPGIDQGGLTKEFFQLITRQLFDPNFSMFVQTVNHAFWFSTNSMESEMQYRLIGIVSEKI